MSKNKYKNGKVEGQGQKCPKCNGNRFYDIVVDGTTISKSCEICRARGKIL